MICTDESTPTIRNHVSNDDLPGLTLTTYLAMNFNVGLEIAQCFRLTITTISPLCFTCKKSFILGSHSLILRLYFIRCFDPRYYWRGLIPKTGS